MSHLGQITKRLIEENNVTQEHVSRITGVTQSSISRLVNGEHETLSPARISDLVMGLGQDDHQRAEILAAHLRDECVGPGANLIKITIQAEGESRMESAPVFRSKLTPELAAVMNFFAEIIPTNPATAKALSALAKALGYKKKTTSSQEVRKWVKRAGNALGARSKTAESRRS